LVELLSRRKALLGTGFASLARQAAGQPRRGSQDAEVVVVAPDGEATSIQVTNDIVVRLGADASNLHAQASDGVADAVARVDDRSRAVAAIVPSTTLAFLQQTGMPSRDVHAHRYIAQLDILTFQTLASQRINDPRQLAGQKVNLGPRGSPTQISAAVLLQQTSLRVDPLYLDHAEACAAVIRGEIPAMIVLAPKPTPLFFDVDPSDSVHFIPLPEPKGRATGIMAAQIAPADYPAISVEDGGAGRGANTVAVPLVLGCFAWAAETVNFAALARLADLLAARGSGLPGFDMTAAVSGWQRFAPVADWLAQGKSGLIRDYAAAETRPAAAQPKPMPADRPPSAGQPDVEQKEQLFRQFLNWRRNR
jgi:hypothetical protein